MATFLMGCLDGDKWRTVCKCGSGFDDATLIKYSHTTWSSADPRARRLQKMKMTKIGRDPSKVPSWLHVAKEITPDFVCEGSMRFVVAVLIAAVN